MKNLKIAALILAASMAAVSMAGCRANRTAVNPEDQEHHYADIEEVGTNEKTAAIGEAVTMNDTEYTLNGVYNTGVVMDGLKYYYLDVTIKNLSDNDYEANALNYFYLRLSDGTEVLPGIRADAYAKQHITGYEHLSDIPAKGEFKGYIGFTVKEDAEDSFDVGFFPSATDIDDKANVVYTKITSAEITAAPDGLLY